MDAQYLKDNVYAAVTEALASMAVALPDDKVEYIGKYLLNYIERKRVRSDANAALELVLSQEKKELENIASSQNSDAASKRKIQDDYASRQKEEEDYFNGVNMTISRNLIQIVATIDELDITALEKEKEASASEAEYDEDGNQISAEMNMSSALSPSEEGNEAETEGPGSAGRDLEPDNVNRELTLTDLENSCKLLNVITTLLQPHTTANQSFHSLELWTTTIEHAFKTPMNDRVVSFFCLLGVFLDFEPATFQDPQTGEKSWRVIRLRLLPQLIKSMTAYDASKEVTVPIKSSCAYAKEQCVSQALLESTTYPKCFPVMIVLCMWLSRAFTAREQAISYNAMKGQPIEIILEEGMDEGLEEE